jgi:Zn ribbon nucleic-acid-binding protein
VSHGIYLHRRFLEISKGEEVMYFHDPLVKIRCRSCHEEFLVSGYVLKQKTDEKYPGDGCFCPYCGSRETEAVTWDEENLDYIEEMGCLAIGHYEIGEDEVLSEWEVTHENGRSEIVEALNFAHAIEQYHRKGCYSPGKITARKRD